MSLVPRAVAFWLGMAVVAVLNGVVRNNFYGSMMTELAAHQLSTFLLVFLFLGITRLFVVSGGYCLSELKKIGLMWLVMTVAFEFVFGHYVAGHSFARLLHDYNLLEGRVWVFVLLTQALGPWLVWRLESHSLQ